MGTANKIIVEMIGIATPAHGHKLLLDPLAHIEYVSVWKSSFRPVSFKVDYTEKAEASLGNVKKLLFLTFIDYAMCITSVYECMYRDLL